MATTLATYGLRPSHRLGASPYNGGFSKIKIFANETTPIFNGDVTQLIASGAGRGHVRRCNTTVTATTVTSSGTFNGVLVGCEYTDPSDSKFKINHNYPGAINATDVYAYVTDDPMQVFRMQADGAITALMFGVNAALIQTVIGNTTTKNSGLGLQASSVNSTNTLPLRMVGFVNDPRNAVGDAFTEVYVRLNTHFNSAATGIAAA